MEESSPPNILPTVGDDFMTQGSKDDLGRDRRERELELDRLLAAWNPMRDDYDNDVGLVDPDDPGVAAGGYRINEGGTKNTPCRFHDGFSGTCWKGKTCVYGHELHTGGVFAAKHPEIAYGATARREMVRTSRLPPKPVMTPEAHVLCTITSIVSPSEFYMKPTKGVDCLCERVEKLQEELEKAEEEKRAEKKAKKLAKKKAEDLAKKAAKKMDAKTARELATKKAMKMIQKLTNKTDKKKPKKAPPPPDTNDPEDYYYGFHALECPDGFASKDQEVVLLHTAERLEDKLQMFLQAGLRYKRLQVEGGNYFEQIELIAARVNERWMRAIVLASVDEEDVTTKLRVQLIDTGEKHTVGLKDVCKLPDRFCHACTAAFKGTLFGVSPVWFVWCNAAVSRFKELCLDKEVMIIVKHGLPEKTHEDFTVFEPRPYAVKVLITEGEKTIDVGQEMIKAGYGLQWNPFPYRPFIRTVINPNVYDFVGPAVPRELPEEALYTEQIRFEWED